MNINDLVTHYVAFRRTLGERCNTTENVLRSFCRAVGPRTPVTRIRSKAVAEFLAGTGPVTRTWHFKYSALKGFFQFAVSRGHMDKAPLPTELPKCPSSFVPYIYSHEELRRLLDAIPSYQRFPSRYGATHPASDLVAAVRSWVAARGGTETVDGRRGFGEFPAHHSRYQVLQITVGSHRPGVDESAERLRPLADRYASVGRVPRATSSSADAGQRFTDGRCRMPSSGCGNMLACDAPTAVATSLDCMIFGIPSRFIA